MHLAPRRADWIIRALAVDGVLAMGWAFAGCTINVHPKCACKTGTGAVVVGDPTFTPGDRMLPFPAPISITKYRCSVCGKCFRLDASGTIARCAVAHPLGTCCHVFETEIACGEVTK